MRNRYTDLTDSVPDELWMEVHDILSPIGDRNQDHSQEKEMQKAKWLSEEALQIAEKRKETKGKGEKGKEKRKDIPI